MGEGALKGLEWFRQVVPRPPAGVPVKEPAARFVQVVRAHGSSAVAEVALVERSFASSSPSETRPFLPPPPSPSREAPGTQAGQPAAAVVLALVGGRSAGNPARLVFIRRAAHLRSNPGEIAYPGGRLEPGESALEAALRETEEEIFLDRAHLRVLGELHHVIRRTRAESIAPFVALVDGEPRLAGNPAEVEEVLLVPLAELSDPDRYFEEDWPLPDGGVRRMAFFDIGEDVIWGASAAILVLLLDRLAATIERELEDG